MTPVITPVTPQETLDALRRRYATKRFNPQGKLPEDVWQTLLESLRLAPSSFGLQPWKFFIVEGSSLREKIRAAAWNQPQIVEADKLVVFALKKDLNVTDVDFFVDRITQVRGIPRAALEDYRGMMVGHLQNPPPGFEVNAWSARQVYIALGFFLETAALLGVDACPMEGFDKKKIDELLGLPAKGYQSVVLAAAGYRSDTDTFAQAAKVRYTPAEVIETIS